MSLTVSIDCMGGDHGPSVTLPASAAFLEAHPACSVILVGLEAPLRAALERWPESSRARARIQPASEVVGMDESPQSAMKNKKDSSMRVALNLVKDGQADAMVSAGNTGALMATARFVLKMLPGIDRPAIASVLPTRRGETCVLDLGANVDCGPHHLLQFGLMGSALVEALDPQRRPRVGLLNIGEEAIKGNEVVRAAGALLEASSLNYCGNIEDIYAGDVDVVVCDGFVGNVALKTSEGLAQMFAAYLRAEFTRNVLTRCMAWVALPVLRRFRHRVDHRRYNGAALLGLRALVVKSHGSADAFGFERAIHRAAEAAGNRVTERIGERVNSLHAQEALA